MKIAAIWRYPVKSMAGERLDSVEVDVNGLAGDRVVQVCDRRGRIVTARRFPRLLRLHATLTEDGEPLVDGLHWDSAEAVERVEAAVGPGAHLRRFEGPERFDVLPLLVCSERSLQAFGRDVRRLRPNLVVEGLDDGAEQEWGGATLGLPGTAIRLADLRARCVMTTYDPDTIEQDVDVLRDIVRRFNGRLCWNAQVIRGGWIRQGDCVGIDTGGTAGPQSIHRSILTT